MKKLSIILAALFAVVSFSTAYAATVQVTLTSPVIVKDGCEKAGSVTFSFPATTQFTPGDWWYMDINTDNVTICKDLNYLVVGDSYLDTPATDAGGVPTGGGVYLYTVAGSPEIAVASAAGWGIAPDAGAVGTTDSGPITLKEQGVAPAAAILAGGDIGFLITSVKGTNRVLVEVVGDAGATLTVPNSHVMKLQILDGQAHNAKTGDAEDTMIITNYLDEDDADLSDDIYGEDVDGDKDVIDPNGTAKVPHVENTLCINAEDASGNTIYTSFASKNDFLTFTGDAQIAHKGSATAISLENCKGDLVDTIEPAAQGACSFDYYTGAGYCTATWSGNRNIISTASTFGQSGDLYDMTISILTPGVYFTADPTLIAQTSTDDACAAIAEGAPIAATWELWAGTDNDPDGYADTSCAVDAGNRVDAVQTTGGNLDTLWQYKSVLVDFNALAYDTSIQGPGEVQVQIDMAKYPCGTLFSQTITLGTFVEECSAAAGATTLVFPYLPPLDGSAIGWWGGYVITNAGAESGIITLTYRDSMGNTGTYVTTDELAAGAMFNGSGITADMLTDADDFNESDNFSIVASCEFGGAVGFAFIGNGNEGTGYAID